METNADSFRQHLERPLAAATCLPARASARPAARPAATSFRISLALDGERGRIAEAGFDASGCGSAIAAGSAAVALRRGPRPARRGARSAPTQIAAELGGLSPAKRHAAELAADALHRALGAAARARRALAPAPGRTLVAMSGGVDSAVAALLLARERARSP